MDDKKLSDMDRELLRQKIEEACRGHEPGTVRAMLGAVFITKCISGGIPKDSIKAFVDDCYGVHDVETPDEDTTEWN